MDTYTSYLKVGLIVFVSPDARSPTRYRTILRGWEEGKWVWLEASEKEDQLPVTLVGKACVFRFLFEGDACGFEATIGRISGVDGSRFSGLYVAWPTQMDTVSVRKHQRCRVQYPCVLKLGSESATGEIRDLSEGGCGIEVQLSVDAKVGDSIRVSFHLPGNVALNDVSATTMTAVRKGPVWLLGCKFDALDDIIRSNLRLAVIEALSDVRRVQRVVVLGKNAPVIGQLVAAFHEADYEVMVVGNLLNMGYWLVGPGVCALVVYGQPSEVSPAQLCTIARSSASTAALPVFFLDDYDESGRLLLLNAGATDAFTPTMEPHKIVDAMMSRIDGLARGPG